MRPAITEAGGAAGGSGEGVREECMAAEEKPRRRSQLLQVASRRVAPATAVDAEGGAAPAAADGGGADEGSMKRSVRLRDGRFVLWDGSGGAVGGGGAISGRGVIVWENGNRYDGHWENGVPKGSGVFTWPDGSCYDVKWRREPRNLNGTFYPAARSPPSPMPPASTNRSSLDETVASGRWSAAAAKGSDGDAATGDIIDTLESSLVGGGQAHLDRVPVAPSLAAAQWCRSCRIPSSTTMSGETKKPGQTISKGHKSYHLMRNLQLGISCSVGKTASVETRELRVGDFDSGEKFWTRFPPEGSKATPPHQSPDFRWKDYCPMVFRHLRKIFSVDPADYMLAICGNGALRELCSPGKSGSVFFLTHDDRFMIKTVKKSEIKVLVRMLYSYYRHVCQYPNTLVTKFYGVHCVKPIGGLKVRFVVMGNLFCSVHRIHRRFDLKGSSVGRKTDETDGEIDESTTFKDLDLDFLFHLRKPWFHELLQQIDQDCKFLEAEGVMDYSLLVGIHFLDAVPPSGMDLSQNVASFRSSSLRFSSHTKSNMSDYFSSESSATESLDNRRPLARLGFKTPARVVRVQRSDLDCCHLGGTGSLAPPVADTGHVYEAVLFFGIIDILQNYDISKRLEHAYKSLHADAAAISAVDPRLYSRRFRDFVNGVFLEDQ